MNIILITEDFPPMVGGIAVFLSELSSGLAKMGNEIRVMANEMPDSDEYDKKQIYPVIRYRILRNLSSLYIGWYLLKQIIRKKPDVLFLGHVTATRGLSVLLFHRFFRIPYVVLIHAGHLPIASKINRIAAYALLRHANLLLANSNYTKQLLVEKGLKDEKIKILTPGVDINYFYPSNDETFIRKTRTEYGADGMPLILNVGRLVPKKNQLRIINAIAKIWEQGLLVKCIIAGSGQEHTNLQRHIEELGIATHVLLIGDVNREKVRELCQAADIVVLPSIIDNGEYESFGIVALEASACAKPVIVGSKGGQGDAVIPDKTGIVVDASDENNIAKAISHLISNKDIAHRIGMSGRQHVVDNFSWNKIAERTTNLFLDMIK